MKIKKHVLFVCATGIVTSTVAAEKVMEYCREHDIEISYTQCNVASLPEYDETADLIISTTNVPYKMKTRVVNALPIITGIGEDELLEQIVEILRGNK